LAIYGMCAGLLIASMRFIEYRFLVADRSVAVYGTVVAAAFAVTGLLLGARLRKKEVVVREVTVEVPAPAHFEPDRERIAALGITPRELEVLELIAAGLSNREMAERLFVSENTVKTHASRVFDKLGAGRRTQAVQIAKQQRIIA
jgi:ATP/maltotriose-dependent transcriptional regulator MalT